MDETTVIDPSVINASNEAYAQLNNTTAIAAQQQDILKNKVDDSTKSINLHIAGIGMSNELLNKFSSISTLAGIAAGKFGSAYNSMNDSLRNTQIASNISVAAFGAISTAILGTKSSFSSLSNIDTSSLNLFHEQMSDLFETLNQSPTSEIFKAGSAAIKESLRALGVEQSKIDAAKTPEALKKLGEAALVSADNALKLQNAMLQGAASSGNFGVVISAAGTNLENMNNLLARQSSLITNAGINTGQSAYKMTEFWSQLAPSISGLKDFNLKISETSTKMDALTAVFTLATGSGRSQKEVIEDINKATQIYGISMEDALTMTARISEVSSKFKIPLQDIRSSLFSITDHFRLFSTEQGDAAKKTEGFTNIINKYTEALKNTGLNGHQAISVVDGMTKSMGELNMAQKAFLSQQTGGPGGLRGAFQIESMLQKDPAKAFELVRKQMQKQMGGIVSQSEAENSEAAAQKRQKQMLILQEGPLGKFAKGPQEAMHILDMFRSIQEGKSTPKELSKTIALDQIKKGEQIQGLAKTPMSELRSTLETTKFTAHVSNLDTLQGIFTQVAGKDTSSDTIKQAESRSALANKSKFNNSAKLAERVIDAEKRIVDNLKNLGTHATSAMHGASKAIGIDPLQINNRHQKADLAKEIEDKKRKANLPHNIANLVNYKPSQIVSANDISADQDRSNPSRMVGIAAVGTSANKPEQKTDEINQPGNVRPRSANEELNVQVNVSAICSVCKHQLENHSLKSISPTADSK